MPSRSLVYFRHCKISEQSVTTEKATNIKVVRNLGYIQIYTSPPSTLNPSATGLLVGSLGAEVTLRLAAVVQHAVEGICVRKSFADALEVLLRHRSVPVSLHATTARVEGKANQRTILVRIEVLGIIQLAHTALIGINVLGK